MAIEIGSGRSPCLKSIFSILSPFLETILAGTPTTTQFGGTSVTTTELAPTLTLSPIVTGPKIFPPVPTTTLSPKVGCLFFF